MTLSANIKTKVMFLRDEGIRRESEMKRVWGMRS